MTARKEGVVRCNAPTSEGGRCTRLVEPGTSCGFHRPVPAKPPPAEERPRPKVCSCHPPIPWEDELGRRCVRCGGWLDLPAGGEQLRLDLDQQPAAVAATTKEDTWS